MPPKSERRVRQVGLAAAFGSFERREEVRVGRRAQLAGAVHVRAGLLEIAQAEIEHGHVVVNDPVIRLEREHA